VNGFGNIAPVTVIAGCHRNCDFRAFLGEDFDEATDYAALRKAETLERPVGSRDLLEAMEAKTGLALLPKKRGPKPGAITGISHLSP
jgi:putative transposase